METELQKIRKREEEKEDIIRETERRLKEKEEEAGEQKLKAQRAHMEGYEQGRMENGTSQWEADTKQKIDHVLEKGDIETLRKVLEALGNHRTDEICDVIKSMVERQRKQERTKGPQKLE